MKKEIKGKLKEIGSYGLCLVVILGVAYYSGILKGFAPKDFENAYTQITTDLSQTSTVKNSNINISRTSSKGSTRTTSYNNYQVAKIPTSVVRGVKEEHYFTEIFNPTAKTIFYFYDTPMDSFDSSVKNFVSNGKISGKYRIYSYSKNDFNRLHLGSVGPSKICDSFQECNEVRQKAADYTSMSEFLKQCGRTMCIINQSRGEYIRLRNRNNAIKILDDIQNW